MVRIELERKQDTLMMEIIELAYHPQTGTAHILRHGGAAEVGSIDETCTLDDAKSFLSAATWNAAQEHLSGLLQMYRQS